MADDVASDQPSPDAQPVRRGAYGLLAAGVLALCGGILLLFWAALALFAAAQLGPVGSCEGTGLLCFDVSSRPQILTFAGLTGVPGALLVAAGVGGCRRTRWGRASLVVVGTAGAICSWILVTQHNVGVQPESIVLALIVVLAATSRPGPRRG